MDIGFFPKIYNLLTLVFELIGSVFNAAVSLIQQLPQVLNFATELPFYVPSFVVAFLLAGLFGSVILIILGRKS